MTERIMREWQLPAAVKLTSKSRHAMIPVALREMYVGMSVCCVVSQQPGAALEWGVLALGAISQQRQLLTRPTQIATLLCASIHPSLSLTAQQPWCHPATFSPSLPYHTCSATTVCSPCLLTLSAATPHLRAMMSPLGPGCTPPLPPSAPSRQMAQLVRAQAKEEVT